MDADGYEELVETTKSLKEAKQIARDTLSEYFVECIIYQEDENGELVEVESVK